MIPPMGGTVKDFRLVFIILPDNSRFLCFKKPYIRGKESFSRHNKSMQYIDAFYNKVSRLFPAPFRVDYLRFGFMPSAGVNIRRLGWAERRD